MKHLYRVKCLQIFFSNTRAVFRYLHSVWLGYETPISSQVSTNFFSNTRAVFHYPHSVWLGYETPVSSQVSTSFLSNTRVDFRYPHNIWLDYETPVSSKIFYQEVFTPRIDRELLPVSTRISRLGQTNSGSTPNFSFF